MEILFTIAIVLLIINMVSDTILSYYHKKHAEVLEKQNELLLGQNENLLKLCKTNHEFITEIFNIRKYGVNKNE